MMKHTHGICLPPARRDQLRDALSQEDADALFLERETRNCLNGKGCEAVWPLAKALSSLS